MGVVVLRIERRRDAAEAQSLQSATSAGGDEWSHRRHLFLPEYADVDITCKEKAPPFGGAFLIG